MLIIALIHSRVWGHMVGESKININLKCVVLAL